MLRRHRRERFFGATLAGLVLLAGLPMTAVEPASATDAQPDPTTDISDVQLQLGTYAGSPEAGANGLQTGTLPLADPGADCPAVAAGNDCATDDARVLTNDVSSAFFAVSIAKESGQEAITVIEDAVVEATLVQRGGAEVRFVTLPQTGLPAACETGRVPASSITTDADGTSVLVCNIGRVESSGVRAVPLDVVATGNSANGSTYELTGVASSDGAATSESVAFGPVEVSATPRFDLVNGGTPGGVADDAGRAYVVNPVTGETEAAIVVNYSAAIEAPDGVKGMASIGSTARFGVSIDQRLATFGAAPVECKAMDDYWAGRWKVPGRASGTNPPSENRFESGSFVCDPTAYDPATGYFSVALEGLDTSGQHVPSTAINGQSLGGATLVALGRIAISYPISAVLKANEARNPDGSLWENGDPIVAGTYSVSSCFTDFEPTSRDGQHNYAGEFEPGWDGVDPSGENCRSFPLIIDARGIASTLYGKVPASGDPLAGDAYGSPHPENTSGRPLVPTGVVARHDGAGMTTPGEAQYGYLSINNAHGVLPLEQAQACAVWDNSQQVLTPYTTGASAGQFVSLSLKLATVVKPLTGFDPASQGIEVTYGRLVGGGSWAQDVLQSLDATSHRYRGDWSAQRSTANDCGRAAAASGLLEFSADPVADGWNVDDILMVRLTAPDATLDPAQSITIRPKLETRETFYGGPHDGATIPSGSVIALFSGQGWDNGYTKPLNYNPNQPLVSSEQGDRMTVQHAIAHLEVKADADADSLVDAGRELAWTLTPSFAPNPVGEAVRGATVVATLPDGLLVDAACAAWQENAPVVGQDAAGLTTVTWSLGDLADASGLPKLSLCTTVSHLVAAGTTLSVTAELRAENLLFTPSMNAGSDSIAVFATEGLRTELSVGTTIEQKDSPQQWNLRWANTSSRTSIAAPDVLFVLPAPGDANGSQFAGTVGLGDWLAAPTVEATGATVAGQWLYTSAAPAAVLGKSTSRAASAGVTWCTAAEVGDNCPASLASVTAARFVQTDSLAAASVVLATVGILPVGSGAGDSYVASFGAWSATFGGQQVVSNAAVTRVLGFTLGDRLWTDVDRDGTFTAGIDRQGPAGVPIEILAVGAGGEETVVQTVTTDADGRWHASNLDSGTYAARIVADRFGKGMQLDGFAPSAGAPDASGALRSEDVVFAATRVGSTLIGNGPDGNGFANNSMHLAVVPVGTLIVSQLLEGVGVDAEATLTNGSLSTYQVSCQFQGGIVADEPLTVAAAGSASVLSSPITNLPLGSECSISGAAGAEPVQVAVVESPATDEFAANTVVASLTRYVAAGTLKLTQREFGGAADRQPTSVNTVVVTCQLTETLANGTSVNATLYSGAVKMVGSQTKQMVTNEGSPRALPVGTHCFATPRAMDSASAVDYNSYREAAVVTEGNPAELQPIRVTIERDLRVVSAGTELSTQGGASSGKQPEGASKATGNKPGIGANGGTPAALAVTGTSGDAGRVSWLVLALAGIVLLLLRLPARRHASHGGGTNA
ncbi:SdrD B-like domain-containing protein [Lysinibacter cavernae]|uniref:SD-repeat containing protein B domain-containing protein n=1 Tax=Lysinibacter cavernae TaxID=1640652 RepID=A0A7X5TUL2_9MICO|nr:SdrD B-like domain-containing protein [Lysinibacter cavernae]NIH53692.1 hypothetical protein [Lysinibacter cavernae]